MAADDDISHRDAIATIKTICDMTEYPLDEALRYYKQIRSPGTYRREGESRIYAVYMITIKAIAYSKDMLDDILSEVRENSD